jgi:hypothetical protein
MLTAEQIKRLKANWGDNAEALNCRAEVRVYDPLSKWECYMLAMDPADDDTIHCIIKGFGVELCMWSMTELKRMHNQHGEGPVVDHDYRPRSAIEILKMLDGVSDD